MLLSIAFPFAYISVFSIHSSSPAIGFHSSIFHGGCICTPLRGGDLRGTGGRFPSKFAVGGRPMHWSSPIFIDLMLSDARESMNRVKKGVFLVRKGSNMTFNIAKIGKIWERKGKIRKKSGR